MQFQFNFYSAILLIFWVNSLVYALLLLKKGIENQQAADKWLSFFLALCTLYISPWMLGFAGWYDAQPYRDFLFYVPFQHLFWIGPSIYFYVQNLLNPSFRFEKKHYLHFLLGTLYVLYACVMWVTDAFIVRDYYFLADGQDRDLDAWYQWTGLISMLIYLFMTIRFYNLYKKWIVQWVSYAEEVLFKWVKNFLMAFFSMQLLQLVFHLLSFLFPTLDSYVGSWWYFLAFAVVSYYIALTGYSNSIQSSFRFSMGRKTDVKEENLLLANEDMEEILEESLREMETPVTSEKEELLLAEWKPKVLYLMETDKAYQDPELTLTQVAKKLGSNPSFMSKIINQGFQRNFNDFVNDFRIEAVKSKIKEGEHQKQTLIGIAYDCGFNSKATFNRSFKKITGQTPKDFIDETHS